MKKLLKSLEFPMAGITRSGYDRDTLSVGDRVKLKPEPDNAHDPNAVQVTDTDGQVIAYIPRPVAKLLSPRLQLRVYPYKARLIQVPSGDVTVWGVQVEFYEP